ncbi:hypothetical protein [Nocardiopsis sp. CA-288880]|uniref:hypothetical protein n=1 Tax=Nocardiopsis sp. CA-288880 TaxID=3239995 RepID=UPI003D954C50
MTTREERAAQLAAKDPSELAALVLAHEDRLSTVATVAGTAADNMRATIDRIEQERANDRPLPGRSADAILAVVAEWCRESWEVGGINAGDLAWRLSEAGYPLPKDATPITDRSTS